MAFTNTETACFDVSMGATSQKILYGVGTSAGGSTGGVVSPGTPTSGTAFSGSTNIRKILFVETQSSSASPSEPQIVVAYNAATDRDEVTFTTAANQVFTFKITGLDSGA